MWNSRGFKSKANRVRTLLNNRKPDIAILTETNEMEKSLTKSPKWTTLKNGNGKGTGVTILLNNEIINLKRHKFDDEGRQTVIEITAKGLALKFHAIYAPANAQERSTWYTNTLWSEADTDILLGDFNTPPKDISLQNYPSSLLGYITINKLHDLQPNNTNHTFTHHNGYKERLDRIYIGSSLLSLTTAPNAWATPLSDHKVIETSIKLNNYKKTKRQWRPKRESM